MRLMIILFSLSAIAAVDCHETNVAFVACVDRFYKSKDSDDIPEAQLASWREQTQKDAVVACAKELQKFLACGEENKTPQALSYLETKSRSL